MKRILWWLGILVAVVVVSPHANPALAADAKWTAKYYNNTTLSGTPVLEQQEDSINYDWGTGKPQSGVNKDNFSVRWVRNVNFTAGTYRFTASTDDGMRVWVDGNLIIDRWYDQLTTGVTADTTLSGGNHTVKVEYFENAGGAMAKLSWDPVGSTTYPDWKGEYFNNKNLNGSPTVTRNDSQINFDWGYSNPATGVDPETFSVRWTRTASFNAGTYRFSATMDDGVRLWVDNNLVIDRWVDQAVTAYTGDSTLTAGNHAIKMEYYDNTGLAVAKLSWEAVGSSTYPDWKGEYFNNKNWNMNLNGAPPVVTRNDTAINFDWGNGSPAVGVNADGFSVRWTRTASFNAGTYRFTATTDDGMRVWVDNNLIIDRLIDQAATIYTKDVTLTAGTHAIKVEYYENLGQATARLTWEQGSSGGTNPPGTVIIDNGGTGYQSGGLSSDWYTMATGYNGSAQWSYNSPDARGTYNWVRWYPNLTPGKYEVYGYIPGQNATTHSAQYWVHTSGGYTLKVVDQSKVFDQWMSLGTYTFSGASYEFVSLSDVTYETYQTTRVAFDAVKFEPRP